jgi:hypothetical protein
MAAESNNCIFCKEIVTIPVLANKRCDCDYIACLFCYEDFLNNNKRIGTIPNCPMCNKSNTLKCVDNESSYLTLSRPHLLKLDELYGNITCPRCKEWIGPRVNFKSHDCSGIYISCNKCSFKGKKSDHAQVCKGCNLKVDKCTHKCTVKTCEKCGKWDSEHVKETCPGCNKQCRECDIYHSIFFIDKDGQQIEYKIRNHMSMCSQLYDFSHKDFPHKECFSSFKTAKKFGKHCGKCGFLYTAMGNHYPHCLTFKDIASQCKKD